jgi:hypothetical protein
VTATLTRARARTAGAGCRRRRRVQRRPCTMLWPRPLESARQYASTPPSGVRAAGGKQRERAASLLLVVRALRTTMTSGAYRRVLTLCTTDRRSRCATQQDPCPIRPEERSNASQATRVQGGDNSMHWLSWYFRAHHHLLLPSALFIMDIDQKIVISSSSLVQLQ